MRETQPLLVTKFCGQNWHISGILDADPRGPWRLLVATAHIQTNRPHSPEWIFGQLKKLILHGARAATLAEDAPELVGALVSSEEYPDLTDLERAIEAENILRQVLENISETDKPVGKVLSIQFMFAPWTKGMSLEDRRKRMGSILGVEPDTARRPKKLDPMLIEFAIEIYTFLQSTLGPCPTCGRKRAGPALY